MPDRKPAVPQERHRRMARDFRFGRGYAEDRLRLWFEHGLTGPLTRLEAETLPVESELIATIERDTLEWAAEVVRAVGDRVASNSPSMRALADGLVETCERHIRALIEAPEGER